MHHATHVRERACPRTRVKPVPSTPLAASHRKLGTGLQIKSEQRWPYPRACAIFRSGLALDHLDWHVQSRHPCWCRTPPVGRGEASSFEGNGILSRPAWLPIRFLPFLARQHRMQCWRITCLGKSKHASTRRPHVPEALRRAAMPLRHGPAATRHRAPGFQGRWQAMPVHP